MRVAAMTPSGETDSAERRRRDLVFELHQELSEIAMQELFDLVNGLGRELRRRGASEAAIWEAMSE